MDSAEIGAVLDRAQAAIDSGHGLEGTGFWRAVEAMKRDPALTEEFADRVGRIDLAGFERWALLTIPIGVGMALLGLGLALGLGLIGLAYFLEPWPATIVFYIGFGATLTVSHGLGHLIVGRLVGIRFTRWFIARISRPQPGVKVDYASYLRTSPRKRAWMHASGALTTKLVPFALIGAARAAGLPGAAVWGLAGIGLVMVATDVAWSTKSSDWMKFRREMRFFQS